MKAAQPLQWATSLFLTTLLVASPALASSSKPLALHPRALSHPDGVTTRIIPRAHADGRLRARSTTSAIPEHDDSFLLSFSAHGQPVTLSLRPSTTLLHPAGVKVVETFTDEHGVRTTTERVMERKEVRAYEGVVVDEQEEDMERWEREEMAGLVRELRKDNWARIVVLPQERRDQDDEIRFQGAFANKGDLFTIHSTQQYLSIRDSLDPEPPRILKRGLYEHPSMVVVRERDVLSPSERVAALRKRGVALPSIADAKAAGCGHDRLPFNTDPMHPVFGHALGQLPLDTTPWSSTFFGMPVRRDPSSPFTLKDRSIHGLGLGYPPHKRLGKRQGDIQSGGNSTASTNFINSIGSTSGCPKSSMVVFVGVAGDCTFTARYGSVSEASNQILTDFNSASSLYQTSFNISLGIVELNIQSGTCPTTASAVDASNPWNVGCEEGGGPGLSLNDRLSTFSQWRGDKGGADGAGLWHLLTNCSTGSEVGVAWLGQLCRVSSTSSGGQTTSGTGVTAVTRSIWQVIAHEIGHNFGAIHDCTNGCTLTNSNPVCCPLSTTTCDADADFVMSPVSEKNVTNFSPCSIGNICTTLSNSLNTTCLATPGASGSPPIISLQSCGNGIVEDGEDCDPGSATDSCCDASTCKFVSGAVCSTLNSLCCTSSCQIASSGTVCRAAVDASCDKEEVCSGSSKDCPADEYEPNGKSCGSGSLACATGVCTSRDQQCTNAGSSLSITRACAVSTSSTCSVICVDPTTSNSCVMLDQTFRDGTPCGYAGHCENASCKAGSAIDVAKSWYTNNLRISIPVTVVVGIIVLLILWWLARCIFCGGGGRRKGYKNKASSAAYAAPPPQMQGSYGHQYPPQQQDGYYAPPPPSHPQSRGSVLRRNDGGSQYEGSFPLQQWGGQQQQQHGGWADPSAYNGQNYR